jgi:hypothetical protein
MMSAADGDVQVVMDAVAGPVEEIRAMLRPDGYDVEWRLEAPDAIALTIVAGPSACADCLVPKPVMMSIVDGMFEDAGVRVADITYPT